MKIGYHSALKKELCTVKQQEYRNDYGIATVSNIIDGLPDYYNVCDIFYSEPAWLDGYNKFLSRANIEGSSDYNDYLSALSGIIANSSMPVILLIGKHAIKKLPQYDSIADVSLHNYKTHIYGWRVDVSKYQASTNSEFLVELSKDYSCIGDFCCGYGNTGAIFQGNGKNWVMSDCNPKCIGYISHYYDLVFKRHQ